MKKGEVIFIIVALVVIGSLPYLFFLYAFTETSKPFARTDVFSDFTILSRTDIRQGSPEVLYNWDTHGGFHGDGDWLAILRYQNDSLLRAMEESSEWKPLPLPKTLRNAPGCLPMFPDDAELDAADKQTLLSAEHGYWFFLDRHRSKDNTTPHDPSKFRDRYSENFTLAVYDADSRLLYIMEMDT